MDKYIIITEYNKEALAVTVNEQIEKGYYPIGGILKDKYYNGTEKCYEYSQAMALRETIVMGSQNTPATK